MESRSHIQCFIHSSVGVISACLERKSSLRCYRIYASCCLFTQLPTDVFHYEQSRKKTIVNLAQTHHPPRHPLPHQAWNLSQHGSAAANVAAFRRRWRSCEWTFISNTSRSTLPLENVKCAVVAYSQCRDRKCGVGGHTCTLWPQLLHQKVINICD